MSHWKIPLTLIAAAEVVFIAGMVIVNQGPVPLPMESPGYQASICTDTPEYSLIMSSVPGMRLIPVVPGKISGSRFHWTTSYGRFLAWGSPDYRVLSQGNEFVTDLRPVYWTYDPGEDNESRPPVTIGLRVEDPRSGTILASTKVRVGWEAHDTAVMNDPCIVGGSPS
jgi:hypothetical protein